MRLIAYKYKYKTAVCVSVTLLWGRLANRLHYSLWTFFVVGVLLWLLLTVRPIFGSTTRRDVTGEEEREHWLQQAKRGKKSFVWRFGILWGVKMFFAMTALSLFLPQARAPITRSDYIDVVITNLLVWPVSGVAYGVFLWSVLQKKYGWSRDSIGQQSS